jgi:hypothetical protein
MVTWARSKKSRLCFKAALGLPEFQVLSVPNCEYYHSILSGKNFAIKSS